MKHRKIYRAITFAFLMSLSIFIVNHSLKIYQEKSKPLVYKLEFPLMLTGAGEVKQTYLLPKGTSLYYDQSFPEGFARYKVYINVEGVMLEPKQVTEKFWLDPLTAFPIGAEQLKQLLFEYPLSKEDLVAVLNSKSLSKEDIRSLLEEYSK
ncbi:hypothetical protein [Comamonas sp. NoAH]|uniref:hypothetical protein n=1 Tax=Comamonas halotolerans TaxID=3041496 RepID=UPI0024E0E192|nr:hypothetical protein [Comamonas sp. NoAH]